MKILFKKSFRLATPLAIDQLGYTDQEAVEKVGIVFSAGCALTAVSFACSGPLAKRQVVSLISSFEAISTPLSYFQELKFQVLHDNVKADIV
jgi:hypothetical protein